MKKADVDMHCHTDWSDGEDTPWTLVEKAKKAGLRAVCKTDHDVYQGWEEYVDASIFFKIFVTLGIEISCSYQDFDVHILGYGLNPSKLHLMDEVLKKYWLMRDQRAEKVLERYRQKGLMQATTANIRARIQFNCPYTPLTRIMQYRALTGNVSYEVTKKEMERGGDIRVGYDRDMILEPAEAVKLILQTDGVPVLAHPGEFSKRTEGDKNSANKIFQEIMEILLEAGLKGLECFYPSHTEAQISEFLALAKSTGLLVTGGSDYHGRLAHPHRTPGTCGVDYADFLKVLKA